MFKQGVNANGEPLRDVFVEHDPVDLYCDPAEGMTRQEFAEECDINVLLAHYERTGTISHLAKGTPQYLDVSNVPDLQQALSVLDAAEAAFMTLPASVRKEFDFNAVKFVEYAQDPANVEQMRKWGLAAPAPTEPAGASSDGGAAASPPASADA